jgi:hypothetical protein
MALVNSAFKSSKHWLERACRFVAARVCVANDAMCVLARVHLEPEELLIVKPAQAVHRPWTGPLSTPRTRLWSEVLRESRVQAASHLSLPALQPRPRFTKIVCIGEAT